LVKAGDSLDPEHIESEQQDLMADLRALLTECFDGARRRDPSEAWTDRLRRIDELRQRLDRMEKRRAISH
jgi:hypothetical protein